jgi:hypothetical protein
MRLARGLLVALLVSASLVAAVAATAARAPGAEDGTLTVRDGRGTIAIKFKGSIIGRLTKGTVTITEPADQTATIIVRGAERTRYPSDTTTVYTGNNIRFRIADDKRVAIKLQGKGLNFSAVGRGDGWVDGLGDPSGGIFFDGSYSLNGGAYQSLPDERTRFELVLPPPPPNPASSARLSG